MFPEKDLEKENLESDGKKSSEKCFDKERVVLNTKG